MGWAGQGGRVDGISPYALAGVLVAHLLAGALHPRVVPPAPWHLQRHVRGRACRHAAIPPSKSQRVTEAIRVRGKRQGYTHNKERHKRGDRQRWKGSRG